MARLWDDQDGGTARVTIVVATYNRPKVLERTLRSVLCQRMPDWRALIIGDACGPETGAMIAGLDDRRICYRNLPDRFGEQAGPNSVGMALADTPFVALLNHDDLWLPDHLGKALSHLEHGGDELYIARAAFFQARGPGRDIPYFSQTTNPARKMTQAYDLPFYCFEPISAWVGRRALFERIGPMALSSSIDLVPVQDYAMRMARAGVATGFGRDVSVLKLGAYGTYANESDYAAPLLAAIEAGRVEDLLSRMRDDLWLSGEIGGVREGMLPQPGQALPGDLLALHRDCGLDMVSMQIAARQDPDWHLRRSLRRRVGEGLAEQPDLDAAIAGVRRGLA